MATRYPVIASADLAEGKMQCFDVAGRKIILINVDGTFYATDEMCSHEDFPLWYGAIKGHLIECSLHGSCFDVRTGHPTEEPATEPIRTYPTEVEGDTVYVMLD